MLGVRPERALHFGRYRGSSLDVGGDADADVVRPQRSATQAAVRARPTRPYRRTASVVARAAAFARQRQHAATFVRSGALSRRANRRRRTSDYPKWTDALHVVVVVDAERSAAKAADQLP